MTFANVERQCQCESKTICRNDILIFLFATELWYETTLFIQLQIKCNAERGPEVKTGSKNSPSFPNTTTFKTTKIAKPKKKKIKEDFRIRGRTSAAYMCFNVYKLRNNEFVPGNRNSVLADRTHYRELTTLRKEGGILMQTTQSGSALAAAQLA